jgi:hypothetical protein
MKKNILFVLTAILMFSSCDDLFTPANENFKDISQMYTDAKYAQGFLIYTYRSIPAYYDNSDYATDDAVTNQKSNDFLRMATGAWTAANNPVNRWVGFGSIQSINLFLENTDKVRWAEDEEPSKLFGMRMKGEAYGMRALFMYYLLRNHSGFTDDGKLTGVPIITEFQEAQSDFNLPRATFEECVQQIYRDLDSAEYYLPWEYENINSDSEIPERFRSVTQKKEVYNRVMGQYARQLYNGLIARAFRTRVSLLAASPAFRDASNTTAWADAADNAAAVIDYIGGIGGIDPAGVTYYANTGEIDALKEGLNPKEIIWRENLSTNNSDQESQNFPPSLFGTGYMNPTQNLVDAFPMANGYPITDSRALYDANNPYSGRDPRLSKYIIYNGSQAGTNNSVIHTGSQSGTDDGINKKETSTRTGYYMKKRLRMDVNCNPSSVTGKTHYTPRIRYTEMFLNYAEAANEAYGPTEKGNHPYSAYDVIKAIRTRAGVGVNNGDPYLEECKADKDRMRTLIHNERRLELCFESFRFWDLRRWKSNLNETVRGMDMSAASDRIFDVENRSYEDYMYYGPIPFSETLKYSNLIQNKGWK